MQPCCQLSSARFHLKHNHSTQWSNGTSHLCKFNSTHPVCISQNVFYWMEVGGSERCREGEKGVMYYKKPGVDERWHKLADIAAAKVGVLLMYTLAWSLASSAFTTYSNNFIFNYGTCDVTYIGKSCCEDSVTHLPILKSYYLLFVRCTVVFTNVHMVIR